MHFSGVISFCLPAGGVQKPPASGMPVLSGQDKGLNRESTGDVPLQDDVRACHRQDWDEWCGSECPLWVPRHLERKSGMGCLCVPQVTGQPVDTAFFRGGGLGWVGGSG